MAIDSGYIQAYINKVKALNKLETYDISIKVCDDALKIDADSKEILFCKGYALSKLGDFKEAIKN